MSSIAEMMSPINSNIAPTIGMSKTTIKMPKAIESINPITVFEYETQSLKRVSHPAFRLCTMNELAFIHHLVLHIQFRHKDHRLQHFQSVIVQFNKDNKT